MVGIVRVRITPSGLFSFRLKFELSKSESLRDVSVTRIGDTFPTVFRRLQYAISMFLHIHLYPALGFLNLGLLGLVLEPLIQGNSFRDLNENPAAIPALIYESVHGILFHLRDNIEFYK